MLYPGIKHYTPSHHTAKSSCEVASLQGLPTVHFAYCKRSKTGRGEGLGTRLAFRVRPVRYAGSCSCATAAANFTVLYLVCLPILQREKKGQSEGIYDYTSFLAPALDQRNGCMKFFLTMLMEQQTVTNPAVIHGFCA